MATTAFSGFRQTRIALVTSSKRSRYWMLARTPIHPKEQRDRLLQQAVA